MQVRLLRCPLRWLLSHSYSTTAPPPPGTARHADSAGGTQSQWSRKDKLTRLQLLPRAGDWACQNCGLLVWSKRSTCVRCGADPTGSGGQQIGLADPNMTAAATADAAVPSAPEADGQGSGSPQRKSIATHGRHADVPGVILLQHEPHG